MQTLNIGPAPKSCGAPRANNKGPCPNPVITHEGSCGIQAHLKWAQNQTDAGEIKEDSKDPTVIEHDKLTCVRATHREQEGRLQARLAELDPTHTEHEAVITSSQNTSFQRQPTTEAEPSPGPSTGPNLLEASDNSGITSDLAQVKASMAELLETTVQQARDTAHNLDDLKTRSASHSQQIESLKRAPSAEQLHHMVQSMGDIKKQLVESLDHRDTQASADLPARIEALREGLVPFKNTVMESCKSYEEQLKQLFDICHRLQHDTKQAFAADEAVVNDLAEQLRSHIKSWSPAQFEQQIEGKIDELARSFDSFQQKTMQHNTTSDNRLRSVKQKVVDCIGKVQELAKRTSQVEEATAAKLISDADVKGLKSSVESQGRRLEALGQQHLRDMEKLCARLEALEQRHPTAPAPRDGAVQQPAETPFRATSVSREEQQDEQV
ncbi:MAG: hypothetical protein Q9226_002249 [Calogaya cf. arnoldii]